MRCLLEGAFEVFDGEAVVAFGVVIGGEGVGTGAREFCVVGDLRRGHAAFDEVVRERRCALFFAALIFLAQDFGGTAVETGTASC